MLSVSLLLMGFPRNVFSENHPGIENGWIIKDIYRIIGQFLIILQFLLTPCFFSKNNPIPFQVIVCVAQIDSQS